MYECLAIFLDFLRIPFQILAILFQKNIEFMTKEVKNFTRVQNFAPKKGTLGWVPLPIYNLI
jgi:hypothetical protein